MQFNETDTEITVKESAKRVTVTLTSEEVEIACQNYVSQNMSASEKKKMNQSVGMSASLICFYNGAFKEAEVSYYKKK